MDFAKLHGTGNDFVVLDARSMERDWSALAQLPSATGTSALGRTD